MINFLNTNEGVIATVGVIVSVAIAIVSFFINKNVAEIKQNQSTGNDSKALQAGRDTNDNSINTKK